MLLLLGQDKVDGPHLNKMPTKKNSRFLSSKHTSWEMSSGLSDDESEIIYLVSLKNVLDSNYFIRGNKYKIFKFWDNYIFFAYLILLFL